jgi:hypothetical protein
MPRAYYEDGGPRQNAWQAAGEGISKACVRAFPVSLTVGKRRGRKVTGVNEGDDGGGVSGEAALPGANLSRVLTNSST